MVKLYKNWYLDADDLATYSGVANEIALNLLDLPKNLTSDIGRHYDPRQQIETRGA